MRPQRWILPLIAIAALCLVAAGTLTSIQSSTSASAAAAYEKTVIIDPGHGGMDGGAVGADGSIEKDINLSVSLKLRSFFLAGGYQVIMTRQDDRSIHSSGSDTLREQKTSDIHNRLKIADAHPNALFLSIHQNLYTQPQYSGAQVFYSTNNPDSKMLAQCLQTDIRALLQPQNDRLIKPAGSNLYILYHARSPAVLVECGFVSNPTENEKLQDNVYQNQLAFSIFYGTVHFYAEQGKTAASAPRLSSQGDAGP
ncbi:N-acetylmuramoyl-L-alanine amidase [Ethanoligenens harbinense]|uniref:Cell wall hydrolase/autolysin n=1 Tax=Ethanoligenens harbinense (strain DSM 18485 / JCM 12961 / CGMCC 1.5033 / YUAN-3) TaxID=663278 RepID=E6U6Y0_ETHHY|nr:N-acetylmuramoyl-L-alanine amidase [Ethanoligenens harbinense]ADU26947.1 cell wall hydrolase/autolysin [Ethanoligenens harbinense YUAN-3]